MTPKEKAKELVDRFMPLQYQDNGFNYSEPLSEAEAKQCALICVDNEYNGTIYVLGELKARGELGEKIYLKALNDLNNERNEVKQEIEKI